MIHEDLHPRQSTVILVIMRRLRKPPRQIGRRVSQPAEALPDPKSGYVTFASQPQEVSRGRPRVLIAPSPRASSMSNIIPPNPHFVPYATQIPSRLSSQVPWEASDVSTPAPQPTWQPNNTTSSVKKFKILPPPSSTTAADQATSILMTPSSSSNVAVLAESTASKTERAISLLQDNYSDAFDVQDLVRAINCLKDDTDASIFLTLKPGNLRDVWLRCLIRGR